MQQKHVFRGKYFGKSDFGHFFCPFLNFPKYFPSKKQGSLLQPVEKKIGQKYRNSLHNVGQCHLTTANRARIFAYSTVSNMFAFIWRNIYIIFNKIMLT